jgi:tetratricopeptide (TPR) repeat protein
LKRTRVLFLAAIGAIAACSTTPPPPPVVAPEGDSRYLIDPRIGWDRPLDPAADRRFDTAWRFILTGDYERARSILSSFRQQTPDYVPVSLAEAAIDIRQGRLEAARAIAERIAAGNPNYIPAAVYEAEIDVAQNQLRSAFERYRSLSALPNVPAIVAQRRAELQTRLFEQLYHSALGVPDAEAVQLLREALLVDPAASAARILLVQKLITLHTFQDARRELDPLLNSSAADRSDVQEALAEIEVGTGQYQNAIVRYELLSRNDPDGRYARRLEQVKQQFAAANMPQQFLRALQEPSINRSDLAVLMYWKIASVRFAQDLATPPIAIDIGDVPGRDEIIRAIALGIFQVDPVNRQVNPYATVTTSSLARTAARVLTVRGASCARGVGSDPQTILAACRVTDPTAAGLDQLVSGTVASAVMDQVDRALK